MVRTSSSSSMGNWKMKTTTMMCHGKGTTPPQKRRMMTSQPRKTQWQEVSCAPGRPMKTTAGTPMMESTAMMAPPAMIVQETTTTMAAAVMTMVMSARFLQLSTTCSPAPTGGRLALMYQADRLALRAIGPSLVMTPFFMNEISF
jgi:hypothetical protein